MEAEDWAKIGAQSILADGLTQHLNHVASRADLQVRRAIMSHVGRTFRSAAYLLVERVDRGFDRIG